MDLLFKKTINALGNILVSYYINTKLITNAGIHKKYMKIVILLFWLLIAGAYAQPSHGISRAENILRSENPNFKKVKRLLDTAEKAQYGFCANAKITALSEIAYLRAKLYYLTSDYHTCPQLLDSGETWQRQKSSDSLKVLSLIQLYGKEKIENLIMAQSNKLITRDSNYLYKHICMDLDSIDYIFCFKDQDNSFDYKKHVTIKEILKMTNFYHLLYK